MIIRHYKLWTISNKQANDQTPRVNTKLTPLSTLHTKLNAYELHIITVPPQYVKYLYKAQTHKLCVIVLRD